MTARVIGIVAALALVALLAAPWYSANLIGPGGPVGEPGEASGWTVLSTTDIFLFACAAIAASGLCIGSREAVAIASVAAGAAVGLVAYRVLDVPGDGPIGPDAVREVVVEWGAPWALVAAAVLAAACVAVYVKERSSKKPAVEHPGRSRVSR